MTEAEWVACNDPEKMLVQVKGLASDRKLRLFSVACHRRVAHLCHDVRSRSCADVEELYADGRATANELRLAYGRIFEHPNVLVNMVVSDTNAYARSTAAAARWLAHPEVRAAQQTGNYPIVAENSEERIAQAGLLRCIFGRFVNSILGAVTIWRTANATNLAQTIYDDRAFDRLPILADALEEAGCTTADVLDHCRQPGEHVRCCWVVYLVLGRE